MKFSSLSSVALDLIRIAASQLVLVGHGISYFSIFKILQEPQAPYMQNIAVVIFFLLSGLLITYSVFSKLENPNYKFTLFLIERFSRIYSALIPALFFIIAIDTLSKSIFPNYPYEKAFDLKHFFGNILMLQDHPIQTFINQNYITSFGSGRPLWTLAIEWWLYMWFGYLTIILAKIKLSNIRVIHVGVLLVLSIVPIYNLIGGRGHGLAAIWLMGAIIYWRLTNNNSCMEKGKDRYIYVSLLFTSLAIIRITITKQAYDVIFALLIAIALFYLLIVFQKTTFVINDKTKRKIKFIADYSFTLYLTHYSILDFMANVKNFVSPYILFGGAFIICNIIAILLAYCSEMRHKELAVKITNTLLVRK